MSFCNEQVARVNPLWDVMLSHRFLIETRDGKIPDERFAIRMRQDCLLAEAAIPFIAALIPRALRRHWEPLAGVIGALEKELKLFEERAAAVGVNLGGPAVLYQITPISSSCSRRPTVRPMPRRTRFCT